VDGGAKTFPIAKLKVPGGNVGEFLSINNVDGTLAYAPMVSATQEFIGSIDAAAGTVLLVGGGAALPSPVGISGKYLITEVSGANPPAGVPDAATQYDQGDWLISNGTIWTHLYFGGISTVTATDVGVAPAVLGGDDVQEVLELMAGAYVTGPAASTLDAIAVYSDALGQTIKDSTVLVSSLATNLYVDAENDAQDLIIAAKGDVSSTAPVVAQHLALFSDVGGKLIADAGILSTDVALLSDLVGLGDVVGPASVAAATNIATYADTTGKLIADGGIAVADLVVQADLVPLGDVKGQAAAIAATDNIAVYNGVDPKAIKDGTISVAQIALKTDITTAQADDVKIAGSTMTGALILSEHPVSGTSPPLQAATIQAIDDAIALIPGATPPEVADPDLTGDGSVATPITWTGVKFDATAVANIPPAFTGNGTTATPLALVLVDGGEYT